MSKTPKRADSKKSRGETTEKISISVTGDSAKRLNRLVADMNAEQDDPNIIYLRPRVSAAQVVGQALAMYEWYGRVRKNGGKVFYTSGVNENEMIEVQLVVS